MGIVLRCLVLLLVVAACGPEPGQTDTAWPVSSTTSVPTSTSTPTPTPTSTSTSTPTPTATSASTTTTTLALLRGFVLEVVDDDLGFPVAGKPIPGEEAFVIVAKQGILYRFDADGRTEWLDISEKVRDRGEQGLLDVAFAPDYPESGRVFVHYSDLNGDTTLSEFTRHEGQLDGRNEAIIYTHRQPASNHNGGSLEFAPDGTLLLALGDGGGAGDRYGHGQDRDTALAAILRFDVSTPGRADPADGNPFPDGGAPEVWMYGLRNPWRIALDDGMLYIADVGQNAYEELSVVPWDEAGLNFGWPVTEGRHCYSPPSGCDPTGLVEPLLEIEHGDMGTCSITGGVVYRGSAVPELFGHYLFSDYCGGWLRSLEPDRVGVRDWTTEIDGSLGNVTGFGVDHDGEVLVFNAAGIAYRLVPVR